MRQRKLRANFFIGRWAWSGKDHNVARKVERFRKSPAPGGIYFLGFRMGIPSGPGIMDEERTRAHNAFISACDILSRNMAESGEVHTRRTVIGQDRKDIGDFACLVHAVLGIMAR